MAFKALDLGSRGMGYQRIDGLMIVMNSKETRNGATNNIYLKLAPEIAKKLDVKCTPKDPNKKGRRDRVGLKFCEETGLIAAFKASSLSEGFIVNEIDGSGNITTSPRTSSNDIKRVFPMHGKNRVKLCYKMVRHDIDGGMVVFEKAR